MLFALSAEGWGMKVVELYGGVRYAVRIEGISRAVPPDAHPGAPQYFAFLWGIFLAQLIQSRMYTIYSNMI